MSRATYIISAVFRIFFKGAKLRFQELKGERHNVAIWLAKVSMGRGIIERGMGLKY